MSFSRDIRMVTRNIVLDMGPGLPTGKGDLGVGTPSSQRCRLWPNYCDHIVVLSNVALGFTYKEH